VKARNHLVKQLGAVGQTVYHAVAAHASRLDTGQLSVSEGVGSLTTAIDRPRVCSIIN